MIHDRIARHIKTRSNGYFSEYFVSPENGKKFTLAELQGFVGGDVQLLQCKDNRTIMVVNENGNITGLPVNKQATKEYTLGDSVEIVGDVLITDKRLIK